MAELFLASCVRTVPPHSRGQMMEGAGGKKKREPGSITSACCHSSCVVHFPHLTHHRCRNCRRPPTLLLLSHQRMHCHQTRGEATPKAFGLVVRLSAAFVPPRCVLVRPRRSLPGPPPHGSHVGGVSRVVLIPDDVGSRRRLPLCRTRRATGGPEDRGPLVGRGGKTRRGRPPPTDPFRTVVIGSPSPPLRARSLRDGVRPQAEGPLSSPPR